MDASTIEAVALSIVLVGAPVLIGISPEPRSRMPMSSRITRTGLVLNALLIAAFAWGLVGLAVDRGSPLSEWLRSGYGLVVYGLVLWVVGGFIEVGLDRLGYPSLIREKSGAA
jgi:hypothetical protein